LSKGKLLIKDQALPKESTIACSSKEATTILKGKIAMSNIV